MQLKCHNVHPRVYMQYAMYSIIAVSIMLLIAPLGDLSIYLHLSSVMLIKTADKQNPSDEDAEKINIL